MNPAMNPPLCVLRAQALVSGKSATAHGLACGCLGGPNGQAITVIGCDARLHPCCFLCDLQYIDFLHYAWVAQMVNQFENTEIYIFYDLEVRSCMHSPRHLSCPDALMPSPSCPHHLVSSTTSQGR